jgi:hypothetical protein
MKLFHYNDDIVNLYFDSVSVFFAKAEEGVRETKPSMAIRGLRRYIHWAFAFTKGNLEFESDLNCTTLGTEMFYCFITPDTHFNAASERTF